ncbi:MAG: hypothetical protein HGB12_10495 [Bacteroidetes bacterium]|nr:hypothetical protein [Bacteroidota bacterium]
MRTAKKLGYWMDNSDDYLMELTSDTFEKKPIESVFTYVNKDYSLSKSEIIINDNERELQSKYKKKLDEIVKIYEDIICYGSTDAKVEHFYEKLMS